MEGRGTPIRLVRGPPIEDAQQRFERAAQEAAHEISGPLSAVTAAIDMLGHHAGPDDPEATELVDLARRQLTLARLRLQRFARLEGRPEGPELQTTDLVELSRTLIADLAWSVLEHHPTTVVADGPVTAEVDPSLLRQLLFNLLTNAARYSPKDRDIVVSLVSTGDHRELRVRDRGHGVAPEDAERIFRRYERGDSPEPGSGIGLAVSREIADVHDGELLLEPAADDAGSTFLLRLPAHPG